MWTSIGFAVFLFAVCGGLLAWQFRCGRATRGHNLDEYTSDFLRRQRRRRTHASVLIGAVGLAVLGALWVKKPLHAAAYWGCVTAVVLWMGLLATADMVSSRIYYRQVYNRQLAEQAALRAELDRLRRHKGNGRPEKSPKGTSEPRET